MNANERQWLRLQHHQAHLRCITVFHERCPTEIDSRLLRFGILATGRGGVAIVRGGKIVRQWCEVKS